MSIQDVNFKVDYALSHEGVPLEDNALITALADLQTQDKVITAEQTKAVIERYLDFKKAMEDRTNGTP